MCQMLKFLELLILLLLLHKIIHLVKEEDMFNNHNTTKFK